MRIGDPSNVALLLLAWSMTAQAQDAGRGNALYRTLPGSPAAGSCISCHGEPVNNRNSVLRGAAGGAVIARTITAVGAMGYLRQYLGDADLADIAAYLATVVPAGPIDILPDLSPTSDQFGAQAVGTQSGERTLLLRNRQARSDLGIGAVISADIDQFPLRHDCPLALPPLGQCSIHVSFRPAAPGAVSATFNVVGSGGQVLRSGAVSGLGVADPPGALAWRESPDLEFGNVALGQTVQRTALLVNPSSLHAQIARLRVTGPNASRFVLDSDCPAGSRLEAGASCELRLRFAPQVAGLVEGWIEIESDASNAPLARVSASGVPAAVEPLPAAPPSAPPGSGGGALHAVWTALLAAAAWVLLRRSRRVRYRSGRRRSW